MFVGAVFLLLFRQWRSARAYKFSLLLFAVSLAEGICLTETGSRMYDGNLWWGAFICYDILLLESLIQLLCSLHKKNTHAGRGCYIGFVLRDVRLACHQRYRVLRADVGWGILCGHDRH